MKGKRFIGIIGVLIAIITVLAGCQALPSSSSTPSGALAAGTLQVNITDAPPQEEIEEVWLTVAGVKIHLAGNEAVAQEGEPEVNDGWLSLALVGDARFNLLAYQGGLQAKLGVGDLAPGKYTQIRMDVTKVEVKIKGDPEGVFKEAKLPSNTLKFVHPFEIVGGQVTEIVFDFDALKSLNVTGKGEYMCKPVIKLTTTKEPKATGGMEIAPSSLPNGGVGVLYDTTTLTATGGTGTYTWSISAGAIPTGLTFDPALVKLSGTPLAAGDFTFTMKVEDSSSPVKKFATKSYTVNIATADVLQITTTSLPDGTQGTPYNAPAGVMLKAINGSLAYTWELIDGTSLPAGLTLTPATGVISGTPTVKGNFSFKAKVTDNSVPTVKTDSQVITIRINKATTP